MYITCFLDWNKASEEAMERVKAPDLEVPVEQSFGRTLSRSLSSGHPRVEAILPVEDTYVDNPVDETTGNYKSLGLHCCNEIISGLLSRSSKPGSIYYSSDKKRRLLIKRFICVLVVLLVLFIGILLRLIFPASHDYLNYNNFQNETTDFDEFTTENFLI